ncbi:MAG: cation transporter [Clostridia bacterium]|nr:cation transporter [Clostridia bacterium]
MTDLLTKIFIKNGTDTANPRVRGAYSALAGIVGILCNVLLFAGKLTLGFISGSVSIIADAFNNISDAGSSIIALIGFRMASKPNDKEHPLGHGRLEYVTGFIVDMLIIVVGFELLTGSVEKIINPTLPTFGNITLIILAASIAVKVWLYFFYGKIARKINSAPLRASAMDSITDSIATALVLASAIVARFTELAIDGYVGIVVAGFIIYTGIKAAKETIDLLLGSPPDPEFVKQIYKFAEGYEHVIGVHDVMVHDYGVGRLIVSFHAEVPSDSDINIAHEEVDKMERDMHDTFGCIVTVHLDPIVVNDPEVNELRALCESSAREVDPTFTIHDFRMTKGDSHVNLIFDLLIPIDTEMSAAEAEKRVAERITAARPDSACVIKVENPFV